MNGPTAAAEDPGDSTDRDRWDARYRARDRAEPAGGPGPSPHPPSALFRLAALLPDRGRAIDLAGGDGGGGLFLARRGLDAVVVDGSTAALDRARAFAAADGIPLTTMAMDLDGVALSMVLSAVGPPAPSIVTCCNFLDRRLLASVADGLPSGARFLAAIATTTNLERHPRPSRRFLLEPGQLASLVLGSSSERLRVLHRREGWAEDRHLAELVVEAR